DAMTALLVGQRSIKDILPPRALPQHQISSNARVPIYEMGSQHKTSLFQKRIACTTGPGPFCKERVSVFEFRESAASFRKQREAIPCNSSEKPTEGGTRCP